MADSDTLTVDETAELLRLKPTLVRSMAARSLLPASRTAKEGADWRFSKKQLLEHAIVGSTAPPAPIAESPAPGIPAARPRSRVLTVEQAAELLQVRPKTVRALAHEGKIPATKVGKPWRFDEDLLREWVVARSRENETRGGPSAPAVPPQIYSIGVKPAAGTLADRLDRLLQAPASGVPVRGPGRG
jgi:excisionase family DNA binding protein